jgi:predicted lipoprotein with Yx(FWY)xxD motif
MRLSRPAQAALRPAAVFSMAALSAAVCLSAAACGTTSPVAGGAYGTMPAAPMVAGSPSGTAAPKTPAKTVLTVRKTKIGSVLATSAGQTVYWFSKDVKGSGKSACAASCLAAWPVVAGTPVAAAGVRLVGKLGTITRPGGVVQATYNGYPLYTYAMDLTPGQTLGNDAAGMWHVITGPALSASPAGAATPSPTATSSGMSGGY